jgi:(p)ppGpp synthase/HD superfamily hydrolase
VASHDTASPVPGDALGAGTPGRRLLALMSLHAITSVYGQSGLRERLLIEADRFPAADRDRIGAALELMCRVHERDRRQREPYACHPLRVTIRILAHYRVTDADVACAALLHDTAEDHAGDIALGGDLEAALAALGDQFGERAARLVAAVTNPVFEPGRDQHEQYRRHVTGSLEASPWARVIKVSDFTDYAGLWIMPTVA